jgi:hypothetical protein
VQVNTWLLIAKRVRPSRVLSVLFYATWLVIRVIFFPYLVWDVFVEYRRAAEADGTWFHPIAVAPIIQLALCGLNAQWTFQLVRKWSWRLPRTKRRAHRL